MSGIDASAEGLSVSGTELSLDHLRPHHETQSGVTLLSYPPLHFIRLSFSHNDQTIISG